VTTLDRLAGDLRDGGLASPAILIIGEVARNAAGNRAALAPRASSPRR
jgi:siroheme synthase